MRRARLCQTQSVAALFIYIPEANYSIVREANRTVPPFPFIFFKPSTCVIGHDELIHIPKIAQDEQAEHEGELCFVIAKPAKNVSREDPPSYIAAYTYLWQRYFLTQATAT